MMGLFLIESMGEEVHLLDGLFNRLDEMTRLNARESSVSDRPRMSGRSLRSGRKRLSNF